MHNYIIVKLTCRLLKKDYKKRGAATPLQLLSQIQSLSTQKNLFITIILIIIARQKPQILIFESFLIDLIFYFASLQIKRVPSAREELHPSADGPLKQTIGILNLKSE